MTLYMYMYVYVNGTTDDHCNTVISQVSAHGRSYFNGDFHCTGRLPCVKIEAGGVNVTHTLK